MLSLKSTTALRSTRVLLPVLLLTLSCSHAWGAERPVVTVMTRNMDAGTDMNYLLAATDQASFVAGAALTLQEIKGAKIPERAALLAEEIATYRPDLIALQEVTLWRTGAIMQPPATEVLYDQLDLLMKELEKRKLPYSMVAVQNLIDAEAPVPSEGIDLRITDRDVVLARNDLPRSEFDIYNVQTHRYQAIFKFGSPIMGVLEVPRGWISADVEIRKSEFHFVNTHMECVYPFLPDDKTQAGQVTELLASLQSPGKMIILSGDFNANAETGPEQTGAVEKIEAAGFIDAWQTFHPGNPGYTWPLFGEDQLSGPATPNERIDLIFTGGNIQQSFGRDVNVISTERIGVTSPWASDHAGVVVKVRLQ